MNVTVFVLTIREQLEGPEDVPVARFQLAPEQRIVKVEYEAPYFWIYVEARTP